MLYCTSHLIILSVIITFFTTVKLEYVHVVLFSMSTRHLLGFIQYFYAQQTVLWTLWYTLGKKICHQKLLYFTMHFKMHLPYSYLPPPKKSFWVENFLERSERRGRMIGDGMTTKQPKGRNGKIEYRGKKSRVWVNFSGVKATGVISIPWCYQWRLVRQQRIDTHFSMFNS